MRSTCASDVQCAEGEGMILRRYLSAVGGGRGPSGGGLLRLLRLLLLLRLALLLRGLRLLLLWLEVELGRKLRRLLRGLHVLHLQAKKKFTLLIACS